MPKALLPMIAALALCGAGIAALNATNARAAQPTPPDSGRKPVMVALVAPSGMAAAAPHAVMAAPPADPAGPPPGFAAFRTQFCKDGYARRVGEMAYFEAKLALTPAQTAAFDRWKQVSLDIARRRADDCAKADRPARSAKAGKRPDLIERMARQEDRLKRSLADLESERPALEGLYNTLNPTQQAELSRGIDRLLMMRGMTEHRMAMGPHMRIGMMGPRGPEMERGRMGPPLDQPPPPPER